MAYLADTNVALRWAQASHPEHLVTRAAIEALVQCREELYITAQNLIEFWNVATRPAARNGTVVRPQDIAEVGGS